MLAADGGSSLLSKIVLTKYSARWQSDSTAIFWELFKKHVETMCVALDGKEILREPPVPRDQYEVAD